MDDRNENINEFLKNEKLFTSSYYCFHFPFLSEFHHIGLVERTQENKRTLVILSERLLELPYKEVRKHYSLRLPVLETNECGRSLEDGCE